MMDYRAEPFELSDGMILLRIAGGVGACQWVSKSQKRRFFQAGEVTRSTENVR